MVDPRGDEVVDGLGAVYDGCVVTQRGDQLVEGPDLGGLAASVNPTGREAWRLLAHGHSTYGGSWGGANDGQVQLAERACREVSQFVSAVAEGDPAR